MPTMYPYTSDREGPVTFDVELTAGTVRVIIEPRERAEITVLTADEEGSSAEAVKKATFDQRGDQLRVRVPELGASGGMVVQSGGGVQTNVFGGGRGISVVQVGGRVYGNVVGAVVTGDGSVYVGGHGSAVIIGGSPIVIEARLPEGSSLEAAISSADLDVTGKISRADVRSTSGRISLESADEVRADTTSGGVRIGAITGTRTARLNSTSGDIRVGSAGHIDARASSGDIEVGNAHMVDARASSGGVRLGKVQSLDVSTSTGSVSIADLAADGRVETSSGNVRANATSECRLRVRTITGDIDVTGPVALTHSTVTGSVRTR